MCLKEEMKLTMKRIWKIISLLVIVILILSMRNKVFAKGEVYLVTDNSNILKGEEFKINIELKDTSVAAFTVQIYFDSSKIEYLSGSENSNYINNRIVYTWFDENGGASPIENGKIGEFLFKAKEEGSTKLILFGEFYDQNGNSLEISSNSLNIEIKNQENIAEVQENVSKDSAELKNLRLDHEGISPANFDKDVTEYYFIADNNIDNLEVTAIPENSKSSVNITGNQNLKEGLNEVKIEVISENLTNQKTYTIYVTKTADKEKANANLENLAVENAELNPEFNADTTEYKIEVSEETENLNILAVPEKMEATVEIEGKENLQVGDNISVITVTAENGFTIKKYKIQVHRRNQAEEIEYEEEQKEQAQKLSAIIEEKEEKTENTIKQEEEEKEREEIKKIGGISLGIVIIIAFLLVIKKWKKKKKTKM